jgi:hypothetical protein
MRKPELPKMSQNFLVLLLLHDSFTFDGDEIYFCLLILFIDKSNLTNFMCIDWLWIIFY